MNEQSRAGGGKVRRNLGWLLCAIPMLIAMRCAADTEPMTMTVTASAYNSLASQTSGDPTLAAWGDELRPGMKVIAVSDDLVKEGLTYGTEVRIKGLKGRYTVIDKMHSRWERKIDIYMGEDVDAALEWGVRKVQISWVMAENDP